MIRYFNDAVVLRMSHNVMTLGGSINALLGGKRKNVNAILRFDPKKAKPSRKLKIKAVYAVDFIIISNEKITLSQWHNDPRLT